MTEINVVVTKNKKAMNYTLNGRKIAYKEKNVIVFYTVSSCSKCLLWTEQNTNTKLPTGLSILAFYIFGQQTSCADRKLVHKKV